MRNATVTATPPMIIGIFGPMRRIRMPAATPARTIATTVGSRKSPDSLTDLPNP